MNNKILQVLKRRDYNIPSFILENYKTLNISYDSFVLLIYLLNQKEPIAIDYSLIANNLNVSQKEVMISIEELKTKKIIEIKLDENSSNKYEEKINLEPVYSKFFLSFIDEEKEEPTTDIYSNFEAEFGRTLSPIEYELINGWQENGYNKEIILEALKESILNGVTNLKYIDKILIEWDKKGIKKIDQIKKDTENYSNKKDVVIPEFDWVNDEENN